MEAIPEPAEPNLSFQARVKIWVETCFGVEIAADKTERSHRFLEEALELVQAAGCTKSEAAQLVEYTFNRPAGIMTQEVGGTLTTLNALCLAHELDLMNCGEIELARCWENLEKIRAKQKAKPKHSPLPQYTDASSPFPNFIVRPNSDDLDDWGPPLLLGLSEDARRILETILGTLNQINLVRGVKSDPPPSGLIAKARVMLRGVLGFAVVIPEKKEEVTFVDSSTIDSSQKTRQHIETTTPEAVGRTSSDLDQPAQGHQTQGQE